MKTSHSIKIILDNGEARTYPEALGFTVMQQGMVYVIWKRETKLSQAGKDLSKVDTRTEQTWVPIAKIKEMTVVTHAVIDEKTELEKYEKFKAHGIDITVTPISQTEPGQKPPQPPKTTGINLKDKTEEKKEAEA